MVKKIRVSNKAKLTFMLSSIVHVTGLKFPSIRYHPRYLGCQPNIDKFEIKKIDVHYIPRKYMPHACALDKIGVNKVCCNSSPRGETGCRYPKFYRIHKYKYIFLYNLRHSHGEKFYE
ncbi:hypothetical protein RF11_10216 [Thelohanellus kitauei]|uniref:Uncharacterized protein n=1 Tax=Thelohanellus kitauei TaxID=669202 RepID=A0A0C2IWB9_THEKT|nr:hypothetical protein RF11_10216 [Thelohanellus kitauei]